MEDAPAPDHLNKFDVIEKDGGVYIKAEEQQVKAGRRQPGIKTKSSGQDKVIVIGGYEKISPAMQARILIRPPS